MPEISLKEYFSKLNHLLSEHAVDEVLLHCRQILQFYPKNVTAYRFLGRALVMSGRWEEGREALRRVLSVIPDDYIAHLGLSEANERIGRPDEAIWHLERAFEQRPNDKELIDGLRGLYSQYRNISNLKIQLTSAAVARQYARSGAYTQAVDTLRSALSRMNERLDLKLLLAQILGQHGEQEEAAELALEVLGVLPDCLEANKIMAQLWLSVNRPSDAQRYVNRLEAVDPYLAVEVAQGYPTEEDTFRLDELDYARTSQSEMAGSRLDWLQEISAIPAPVVEAEKETVQQDWSDWASAMLSGKAPPMEPEDLVESALVFDEEQPTSSRFEAVAQDDEPVSTGYTATFGSPEDVDEDELSAMFASTPTDGEDPMAWLHEAGVEIVEAGVDDEPSYDELFAADADEMLSIAEEDPMAWLGGDPKREASSEDDKPALPALHEEEDDPFAWMDNDAGVTLEDVLSDTVEEAEGESLDWLQDERVLDEALSLDGLTSDNPDAVWDSAAAQPDLADEPSAMFEESSDEDLPDEMVPGPRRGLTAMLQEANLDWITKAEEEVVSDNDMDEWLTQFGASSEQEQSVTDSPDWLDDLEQPQTDEQAVTMDMGEPVSPFAVSAAEEEATGMSDEQFVEPENPEDESVDWMRELTPEPEAAADDEFVSSGDALAADDETEAEESAAEEAEIPDWVSELEPEAEPDAEDADLEIEAPAASEYPWMNEEAGAEEESEADESEAAAAEMPDWMSELEPEPEASAEEDLSWVNDEADAEAEAEEADVVAAEIPDWVSELEPETDGEEAESSAEETEPEAEEDLSWLDEEALVGAGEAVVAAEMPDWMSELEPESEAEADAEDAEPEIEAPDTSDFPWMAEEESEVDQAEAVTAEMSDWMSELKPESEADADIKSEEVDLEADTEEAEPEIEAPDTSDFPWMADESETEQPVVTDSEYPWMNEEADAEQPEEVTDEPEADEVIPASSEADVQEEEAEALAESIPRWLSDLEPEEEDAVAEEPSSEDDLSWLDEEDGEAAADDESTPDWLTGMEEAAVAGTLTQDYDADDERVAELSDDAFDDADEFDENEGEEYAFLAEVDDEHLDPSPAHNAPDWLNAMVPGLDVDYEPGDDEFEEEDVEELSDDDSQREFAWLNKLVDEEMAATERPDFAFSRPPTWVGASAAFLDDGSLDDDLPDWPSDDADADVPEWLR